MRKQKDQFKAPLNFQNSVLSGLLGQINAHKKVLEIVRKSLPSALSGHVAYAFVIDRRLLVYADSAAWAAQLRFYNQEIRKEVGVFYGKPLETLHIKLIDSVLKKPPAKPKIPSLAVVETIENDSLEISDPQLKAALQSLSVGLRRKATD